MIYLLVLGLLLASNLQQSEAQVGVCYGTQGDKLPSPQEVVALLKENKVQRVRIFEPNEAALNSLRGQNIEVVLGVPNELIPSFVTDQKAVDLWVQKNLKAYVSDIRFRYLVVGTEISIVNDFSKYAFTLLQVLENVEKAVAVAGLKDQLKITTALDVSNLNLSSVPSKATFNTDARTAYLLPILNYLQKSGSPFLFNVYPYYTLVNKLHDVKLDYALFQSSTNVKNDGNLGYSNLFDELYDSLVSALEKEGFGDMEIVVAETGWPSAGGDDANVENEKTYTTSLMEHVKKGTPKRPGKAIETYLYSVFNENKKDGPEIERHFGLFHSNKKLKFPLTFH